MKFLKKLFGDKEKEISPVQEVEELSKVEEVIICSQCNMSIHPDQMIKTFAGEKIHMKPCWFKMRKEAKKLMR